MLAMKKPSRIFVKNLFSKNIWFPLTVTLISFLHIIQMLTRIHFLNSNISLAFRSDIFFLSKESVYFLETILFFSFIG